MVVMLEFKKVSKAHKSASSSVEVLKEVDFQLKQSEAMAILGPSGAGKTTLLQIAGLLDYCDSGSVFVNNMDCTNIKESQLTFIRRQLIGFIYQFHFLIPEMTALENVMLPLRIMRIDVPEAEDRAITILNRLGIGSDKHKRYAGELSGGESQRVAIARAFVTKPSILLADEPTGNLDEDNADVVSSLILELSSEYKAAVLVITHNERLARKFDRIMTIHDKKLIHM